MPDYLWSLIRFGLLTLLSFALTLGLTTLSVEVLKWDPTYAHVLTLLLVMSFNGWALVQFVFPSRTMHRGRFLWAYVWSSLIFRALEWSVFVLLIRVLEFDYRLSIICVNPCFALLKFVFLRRRSRRPDAVPDRNRESDA